MTTPPKPLSEKELDEMLFCLARMDTYAKTHAIAWKAVKELKRLRSLKTQEKILRDGLFEIETAEYWTVDGARHLAREAMSQADAAKEEQ